MSFLQLRQVPYLGQAETPDVKTLPWDIDRPRTEAEVTAEKRQALWNKTTMVVGLIGGVLGIYLSWRAIRGSK